MKPLVPAPDAAPEDPVVQLCAFYVGGTEYVLDVMRIDEILQVQPITPVPDAPPLVEGVISLRGAIVPVIDPRRQLGKGNPPARLKPKLLVCFLGRKRIALHVDGVSQMVRLRRSELRSAPAYGGNSSEPLVIGVCGTPERLKLLLNLKAVLAVGLVRAGQPAAGR